MAPGVSEVILLQITDLHSDLKNTKCRIQYGSEVNLINFYKPRLPYWIRHFEFF